MAAKREVARLQPAHEPGRRFSGAVAFEAENDLMPSAPEIDARPAAAEYFLDDDGQRFRQASPKRSHQSGGGIGQRRRPVRRGGRSALSRKVLTFSSVAARARRPRRS